MSGHSKEGDSSHVSIIGSLVSLTGGVVRAGGWEVWGGGREDVKRGRWGVRGNMGGWVGQDAKHLLRLVELHNKAM